MSVSEELERERRDEGRIEERQLQLALDLSLEDRVENVFEEEREVEDLREPLDDRCKKLLQRFQQFPSFILVF